MQISFLKATDNENEIVSSWIHFFYDRINAQDMWKQ